MENINQERIPSYERELFSIEYTPFKQSSNSSYSRKKTRRSISDEDPSEPRENRIIIGGEEIRIFQSKKKKILVCYKNVIEPYTNTYDKCTNEDVKCLKSHERNHKKC